MLNKTVSDILVFFRKNYGRIILSLVALILLQLIVFYFKNGFGDNYASYKNNNFSVFGLNIPRNLSFCDEKIPTNDYALKDNLEKEFFKNKQWKNNAGYLFSKAQKWFPYIEPILKKEGVPDDFKYVAVIESHLSNAVSPAGAAGFWQLVPTTARHYGLIVNENVDERLEVEKATHAACKLIKYAYSIFQNWTLSAAAYNLGIGGIQNAMAKQKSDNYYDLLLNRETGSFIYRILAYKTLFANPENLGLKKKSLKYYPKVPIKIIKVDSSITNLNHFAKSVKCNIAILKLFNPWLLEDKLNNPDKHVYEFKIPKKSDADYSSYYTDLLKSEIIDSNSVQLAVADSVSAAEENVINHLVSVNENLKDIADFYDVNVLEIKEWNNITDSTYLKSGTRLIIKLKKY
ncbi:MAG: transglycosylase SLT domain-containing protein [Bacteroidia bacterium]|nr:transglycosylase SLT domain-containing protein [Bacteroidia bacterium]